MSGTVTDMLNVARSQIGYNGAGTEDNPDTKYGKWFGYNAPQPSAQWCDMFLSWCADQAGVDMLPPPKGSAGVASTWNAYEAAGLTTNNSGVKVGDLIVFDYSDHPNHIGIVESVDSASQLTTIQGNTTDAGIGRTGNCCRRKIVNRNSSYIVGYCRPQYVKAGAPPAAEHEQTTEEWMASNEDKVEQMITTAVKAAVPSATDNANAVWAQAGKKAGLGNGELRSVIQATIREQADRVIAAIEGLPAAVWDQMNARLRKDDNAMWRLGQAVVDRINQNGWSDPPRLQGMARGLGTPGPVETEKEASK